MTFSARSTSGISTGGNPAAIRVKTGSPVTADSSTLTDANIPTTGIVDCTGLSTIWVAVEMSNAGTQIASGAGSILLDQLWRDGTAADGFRWKRPLFGAISAPPAAEAIPLDAGGGWIEMRVDGAQIFPRISSITG